MHRYSFVFVSPPTMVAIVTVDWPCGIGGARHGSLTRVCVSVCLSVRLTSQVLGEGCLAERAMLACNTASSHCPYAALALITHSAPHRKCHNVPLNAALMFIATEAFRSPSSQASHCLRLLFFFAPCSFHLLASLSH